MNKQNHILYYGLIAILIIVVGWMIASPYWVLYQIRQAYEHNQPEKIAQYIDFSAVKSSLKPQVEDLIQQKTGLHLPEFAQSWGGQLSTVLSATLVDSLVNPTSIMLLLQGKALKESIQLPEITRLTNPSMISPGIELFTHAENKVAAPPHASTLSKNDATTTAVALKQSQPLEPKASYSALNRFDLYVPLQGLSEEKYTVFIMQRRGWSWKIVEIQLPNASQNNTS
ncbi:MULTISPECIES: DUF2939 domain-containing protein [unclassified Acinetobacter]|uniref:DUF2939 domain-containing protein n=1 Tax=unclassified Acinetobacter TaxID=196816 RepID=UPI0015D18BE8|nr:MULTISPECIES: DUF2939 domain-containing protein [unclassified Acinetobacter]UUS58298.1 DUF2939 domain-containing protein [Acinetobacter sp. YH16040_T]